MKLTARAGAMLAGEFGPARQWAVEHQMQVGRMFDAADMVEVSQAHMMADPESTGVAGVELVEKFAALPMDQRLVEIPMITALVVLISITTIRWARPKRWLTLNDGLLQPVVRWVL